VPSEAIEIRLGFISIMSVLIPRYFVKFQANARKQINILKRW